MMHLLNLGLSKKTILIVLLCLIAGLTIQTVIYLSITEKLQQQQLSQALQIIEQEGEYEQQIISTRQEDALQLITNLMTMMAAEAIMSYDFMTLERYVTAISNDPDIVYAVFLDPNGRFFAGAKELPEVSKQITHELVFDDETIGTLKIGLDTSRLQASMDRVSGRIQKFRTTTGDMAQQNRMTLLRITIGITVAILLLVSALVYLFMRIAIILPLHRILKVANAVANGDFHQDIVIRQHDEIGILADAFRKMKDTIGHVLQEINHLIQAVQEGKLDSRGNAESFDGGWRDLVVGVNNVIDAFITPITMVATSLRQIAQGDIPTKIIEEYNGDFRAIQEDLNVMIRTLGAFTLDIRRAADQVASGSRDLSMSADQMSQGASRQASTAEEVSSTMEQIAANIRHTADNALQTEQIAMKAAEGAREGAKAVAEAVVAMQKIAKKISIIEEIVGQTHMLSLNATIEAAKAEEKGKGFAVVAYEVRALAERSREAAEEINELANFGVDVAEKAGEMLNQLVPDIEKTARLIQEISAANNEQKAGAEQVNQAVQQLDQVIQQNASIAEETAATAEELSQQAEQLQNTIAFFNVTETVQETEDEWSTLLETLQTLPAQDIQSRLRALEALTKRVGKIVRQEETSDKAEQKDKEKEKEKEEENGKKKPAGWNLDISSGKDAEDNLDQEFERY